MNTGKELLFDNNTTTSGTFNYKTVTTSNNIPDIVNQHDFTNEVDIRKRDGITVDKRLAALEEQVLLIHRDEILEEEFEELKEAYQAYNDLLAKLKTFKALKDSA